MLSFARACSRLCHCMFPGSSGPPARSLYEAAALAVAEFRRHDWVDALEPGTTTKLAISVKPPAATHEVSIRQLEKWTAGRPRALYETLSREFERCWTGSHRIESQTRPADPAPTCGALRGIKAALSVAIFGQRGSPRVDLP
jgi:hypothetical protein